MESFYFSVCSLNYFKTSYKTKLVTKLSRVFQLF